MQNTQRTNGRTALTRAQKEFVFFLSMGTFLEYFDLMLYTHMAVFLNELFFPQGNPLGAKLLAAFALCSTYFFRPLGGYVIGWIGDNVGRRSTIMITTFIMAASCVTMATLPTYAEIGITATIVMLLCRILQGFSSLGEIVGAELYIAETLKQPQRYMCNALIDIGSKAGGAGALIVATLAISINLNWRTAFWIGAVIAGVGLFARARLRETPEFVDYKRRMAIKLEPYKEPLKNVPIINAPKQKLNKKALLTYFIMHGTRAICFYIAYIHLGNFMKESLGFTAEQVIHQNMKMTIFTIFCILIARHFVKKYHPVKIARVNLFLFSIFLPFAPYLLNNLSSIASVSFVQFMFESLVFCTFGTETTCFGHLPVARRFTLSATTYGLSTASVYAILAFGLIPLTKYFGHYSLWIIYIPISIAFLFGLKYIKKLEIKRGMYRYYPDSDDVGRANSEKAYNYYDREPTIAAAYATSNEYSATPLNEPSNKIEQPDEA